jgi:hypothetical protein
LADPTYKTFTSKPVIIIQPKIFYHRKRVVKLKSQILAKFKGASRKNKQKNAEDLVLANNRKAPGKLFTYSLFF